MSGPAYPIYHACWYVRAPCNDRNQNIASNLCYLDAISAQLCWVGFGWVWLGLVGFGSVGLGWVFPAFHQGSRLTAGCQSIHQRFSYDSESQGAFFFSFLSSGGWVNMKVGLVMS